MLKNNFDPTEKFSKTKSKMKTEERKKNLKTGSTKSLLKERAQCVIF
jgi:hypothetical protein